MLVPSAVIRVPDFLGRKHLVETGLFHVQDLSLERQDSLEFPVPSLLGRTTGRIAFHQVKFAQRRVPFLAIGQLAGKVGDIESPFAPGQFPWLCVPLPGLGPHQWISRGSSWPLRDSPPR